MSDINDINKKAGKAGLWYTIGNIILKGVLFFSLPVFTRIMLPSDFGYYNNYIAYEQILTAILGLGMYGTIKNAKLDFKDGFENYFSIITILCLLGTTTLLFFSNLFLVVNESLFGFNRFEINLLIAQSFGAALLYMYGVKLNVEFKYIPFLLFSSINTIGNVLLSYLLIIYVFPLQTYLGRIIGSAIPLLIISTFIVFKSFSNRIILKKDLVLYAVKLGIPLIPHVLSQSLLNQFDRIMIKSIVGFSEAGIYGCIYTLSTILSIIAGSIENAWSPWAFITLHNNKKNEIKHASKECVYFFALLTFGFMSVMPELSRILIDSKYWSGISLIFPLSVAMFFAFLYTFPANIEYYERKTSLISTGTIMCALINIILNYICIKFCGYKAAAYTTLISYIILYVFHWKVAENYDVNSIYDKEYFRGIAIATLAIGIILDCSYTYYWVNMGVRAILLVYVLHNLLSYRTIIYKFLQK